MPLPQPAQGQNQHGKPKSQKEKQLDFTQIKNPRRAQERRASIPFESQYKSSRIHGKFLNLGEEREGEKEQPAKTKGRGATGMVSPGKREGESGEGERYLSLTNSRLKD